MFLQLPIVLRDPGPPFMPFFDFIGFWVIFDGDHDFEQASWYEYSRRPPSRENSTGWGRGYSYELDWILKVSDPQEGKSSP